MRDTDARFSSFAPKRIPRPHAPPDAELGARVLRPGRTQPRLSGAIGFDHILPYQTLASGPHGHNKVHFPAGGCGCLLAHEVLTEDHAHLQSFQGGHAGMRATKRKCRSTSAQSRRSARSDAR